jgi:hypothetical protein
MFRAQDVVEPFKFERIDWTAVDRPLSGGTGRLRLHNGHIRQHEARYDNAICLYVPSQLLKYICTERHTVWNFRKYCGGALLLSDAAR